MDSPDQPGSPHDSATISLTVMRSASHVEAEFPSEQAQQVVTAPALDVSGSVHLLHDADNGVISPGDVVAHIVDCKDQSGTDAHTETLVWDYDQGRVALYGAGGMMRGTGGTFQTEIRAGVFWTGAGWLPGLHDRPWDDNYNGVIEVSELPNYVAEFDDGNPGTGQETCSTNLAAWAAARSSAPSGIRHRTTAITTLARPGLPSSPGARTPPSS